MPKPPLNYTTTIAARRTVTECADMLAQAGAARVAVDYADGEPSGVAFRLKMPSGWQDFVLPVNIQAVEKMLAASAARPHNMSRAVFLSRAHAANVAWRVVRDWLEAQLAIIAAEMVTLDQVMLPYLQLQGGSLYEVIRDQHLALPAATS